MAEKFYPKDCNDDHVISFSEVANFKVGYIKKILKKSLDNWMGEKIKEKFEREGLLIPKDVFYPKDVHEPLARWFKDGIDCEILNLGSQQWKKGKFRVKLDIELCVESQEIEEISNNNNSESSLDDLRQKFNQENQ